MSSSVESIRSAFEHQTILPYTGEPDYEATHLDINIFCYWFLHKYFYNKYILIIYIDDAVDCRSC